jgi:hypothetical protein
VSHDHWLPPADADEMGDKVRRGEVVRRKARSVCFSFITHGRILFLSDCTHALARQTVDVSACSDVRWSLRAGRNFGATCWFL